MADRWCTGYKCLDPSLLWAALVFITMRIWLSLVGAVTLVLTGFQPSDSLIAKFYLGQEPVVQGLAGIVLGPWQRWDALWYTKIARWGYAASDGSTNLFPLYPMLTSLVGRLLGGRYLPAGILVSNLSCLVLFVALYRLTALEADHQTARRTVAYLGFFPTAFFLLAPYTESLLLAAIVGSLLAARQGHWWRAGLCGLAASLAKLPGVLVVVPLTWIWWWGRRSLQDAVPLVLPPIGTLGFMVYRYFIIGNPAAEESGSILRHPFFYPRAAQDVWAWRFVMPWEGMRRAVAALFAVQDGISFVRAGLELTWVICLAAAALVVWRRLPGFYGVYMGALLLVMLMWVDATRPYSTIYRHGLLYFPAFMIVGVEGKRPWVHRTILGAFVPSQALFMAFFVLWYWMG